MLELSLICVVDLITPNTFMNSQILATFRLFCTNNICAGPVYYNEEWHKLQMVMSEFYDVRMLLCWF